MKIIDAHIHYSEIESFHQTADEVSLLSYTPEGLAEEFRRAGVIAAVGMGVTETAPGGFPDNAAANPMGLNLGGGSLDTLPKTVFECAGINPHTLHEPGQLEALEKALQHPKTVGIKLYAGYYHFAVNDPIYDPVYALASKYKLPIVIHGGLTYSDRGLLKYSHPLSMEEALLAHRDITFMICHLGDPWVMDTAAMLEKNPNLYADLSGWIVGDDNKITRLLTEQTYVDHFKRAIVFAERYDRLVFGTDWPLIPIDSYIRFVKHLIPEKYWHHVFYQNALDVFPKLKDAIQASETE